MKSETLLSTLWNDPGTEKEVVEHTLKALQSEELELVGNFRNWKQQNITWRLTDETLD